MVHHHRLPAIPRLAPALALAIAALVGVPAPVHGEAAKHVLIIRGESPENPGGTIIVEAIESALREELSGPVEFYVETLDRVRFSTDTYDERLASLMAEKYRENPVDIVVAFTSISVDFILRHRSVLFPRTPVLLGFIERRFLDNRSIGENAGVVFVQVDAAGTLRLALNLYPKTRQVVVVGGTSDFDRHWEAVVREDLREFGPRIPVTYEFNSTVEDLVWMAATLQPDTIVLYTTMTRDGANVPTQPREVLHSMREAAKVPIFGLASNHLGYGIVGGELVDIVGHGAQLGKEAARLLRGEPPAVLTTPTMAAVDWREMQRFGMSAVGLPPGTNVAFREPGLWERNKAAILAVGFVVFAESTLIFALVWEVRRRREAQHLLQERLNFQTVGSQLSIKLTSATPAQIEDAVDSELAHVAEAIGIDRLVRWKSGLEADKTWESPQLRSGQTAVFESAAELPPSVKERLGPEGADSTAIAVPLAGGGVPLGALFWVSGRQRTPLTERTDELEMISTIAANVLERRRAEAAFATSDALRGAILDSLPSQVAVLDCEGRIIAVNDAWLQFAGPSTAQRAVVGIGAGYLDACRRAAQAGDASAAEAIGIIEAACAGRRENHQLEYQCHTADRERWFTMRVEPLRRAEGGAVVTHTDITVRKMNEIALRESEDRFRRMSDALPVGVWMSEADGLCSYFNKQWLDMTGRTLEQEMGEGWLEAVHPDDRLACKEEYLRAFHMRKRLVIEYRIRRYDGEYRWLLDIGMPRYGSDGVFHGYVGGVIDITDRIEAEQLLHDLNQRLIAGQEEERRRIARELHDHLNQQLALLAIDLQQLSTNPPGSIDELAAALQEQWRRTGEIASDVHAISHRLHPSKLEALGLVATMRAHCRDISRHNLAVHFSEQNVPSGIPSDISLCLFRVLEEALSNVVRHSGASEAHVTLMAAGSDLVLRVLDSGSGFRPSGRRFRGLGLVSMRERLQALGGTTTVTSAPGKGTVVEARVPMLQPPSQEVVANGLFPTHVRPRHPGAAREAVN